MCGAEGEAIQRGNGITVTEERQRSVIACSSAPMVEQGWLGAAAGVMLVFALRACLAGPKGLKEAGD